MYSVASRSHGVSVRVIPLIRKLPQIGNVSRIIVPGSVNKTLQFNKNYFTDARQNEHKNVHQLSYKYLLYSILFSAVTYTSYKIW